MLRPWEGLDADSIELPLKVLLMREMRPLS
jgi:hypothetical protein